MPSHIAIIMDGNGRWASARHLPRMAGHQQGVESVRAIIEACLKKEIACLTFFGFSSENWRRPKAEVDFLLSLFSRLLKTEIKALSDNGVRLRIIGDRSVFPESLKAAIHEAEAQTYSGTRLNLSIAFNYGGRWDLVQAMKQVVEKAMQGAIDPQKLDEDSISRHLALADLPEPDLLIRTSGEYRISNFLLWQCAYTELYFSDVFWPDFREAQLETALIAYAHRERRFGNVAEASSNDTSEYELIPSPVTGEGGTQCRMRGTPLPPATRDPLPVGERAFNT
ncbi:MAG: isoprenyl transferase [Gammaproteobacteria bacterium]|nr:isoprenyl transferase [Gammaproteobacteria bacterium]MBP9729018.1 isoprenyl transferase [Gammaproteobacteria bacterium]